MHLPTTSPASARLSGSARPRALKTALACGLLSGGLAVSAQAADAAYFVNVKHQTLAIMGNSASDKLALRLRAGAPQTLQVDVTDDGSADFQVARNRFKSIRVNAGGGNDLGSGDDASCGTRATAATSSRAMDVVGVEEIDALIQD